MLGNPLTDPEWSTRLVDTIERVVGKVRSTVTDNAVKASRALVYGALYLWAFWDPFGNVNKMPVALVNADKGTEVKGQKINAGAEVEKSLADDKSLDWHLTQYPDHAGLQNLMRDLNAAYRRCGALHDNDSCRVVQRGITR